MSEADSSGESDLILYRSPNGAIRVGVLYGELQPEPTLRKIRRVQREGARDVTCEIEFESDFDREVKRIAKDLPPRRKDAGDNA